MKPIDLKAASIQWGIELETRLPAAAGVQVGAYHNGLPVQGGRTLSGLRLEAPDFHGARWKAERDGSIRCEAGQVPCEFVSPVLHGEAGVEHLAAFVGWMNAVGASVNASCGCHITVGIESVIGTSDTKAVSEFIRKLAHIGRWHARSLYGQTGTGRHLNHYSHPLYEQTGSTMRKMITCEEERVKAECAEQCGRGMINFKKAFRRDARGRFIGVVEFRVFAGTTTIEKIMHHLASVLGLCRRACEVRCLGGFGKNKIQAKRTATASDGLRFLWDYLGWTGSARPVALGLFGKLHSEFRRYRKTAQRLCQQFDERYPDAA
ncbi:amidoligase family protein, partial [Prosthecobacter sp.]|uniref:amidoligase family protein n=1 Tax=Prosthecobacter sp. TaxID=1965333 RepID=UPI00378396DE